MPPSLFFFFLIIFICLLAAPGFSFVACGIQFPDEGSNPGPLHQEHAVLDTGPPGKSPHLHYLVDWRRDGSIPPQITCLSPQHKELQYNYNNPLDALYIKAFLFSINNLEHFWPYNEYL